LLVNFKVHLLVVKTSSENTDCLAQIYKACVLSFSPFGVAY